MSLDGVWNQIKSDESEIYGMKMIDVFIMLTKELDSKHYEQLTSEQRKNLSGDAAFGLLSLATINDQTGKLFAKRIKEMGSSVDRMDSGQLYLLIDDICANIGFIDYISLLGNNLKKIDSHDSYVIISRILNRVAGRSDGQKLFKKSIEASPEGKDIVYEDEAKIEDLIVILKDLFISMKTEDLGQVMARYDFSFSLLGRDVFNKLESEDLINIIHHAPINQRIQKASELKKILTDKLKKISKEDFSILSWNIEQNLGKGDESKEIIQQLKEIIYG